MVIPSVDKEIMEEFNALGIAETLPITDLCQLNGAYVNLEYELPNGETIKLLDDSKIYPGCQVIVIFKKRKAMERGL